MTDTTSSPTALEEAHPECPTLYQYGSLEDKPRTIRLLKIDHACGNGPLYNLRSHCDCDGCNHFCCKDFNARMPVISLREACLDASPEYDAISYAWGSATLEKQVACDSKVLRVTQSCYDLLCRLRKRDSDLCAQGICSTQARSYWIDAICINQGFQEGFGQKESSQKERSHQVAMMATVYENAVQVVVWPGYVEPGYFLIDMLQSAFRRFRMDELPQLRSLIQKPYFTRIWPLQEIALAQSCIILVGERTVAHSDVVDIRSVFLMPCSISKHRSWYGHEPAEVASVRLEYERVTTLHRRLLGFFQSRLDDPNATLEPVTPPPISEVLLHARSHQASEPRDKVFALYGIFQRLQAYLQAPDYLRAVDSIYLEASSSAVQTDRSLHIFEGLTGVSRCDLQLPSWSPDWSDHQHITRVAEWKNHKASGLSEAQPCIQGQELSACGLLVDAVYREHITFAATPLLVEANTLTEKLAEPLHTRNDVPVHQYLGLLESLFLDTWKEERVPLNLRQDIHRKQMESEAKGGKQRSMLLGLLGRRVDQHSTEGFLKDSFTLHRGLCYTLDRKKLFETRDGRLGIASRSIEIGDSIVLLQGCNLPMVIRPAGNKWKLVAPAYLPADGIMDGKLWKPDGPLSCFSFV